MISLIKRHVSSRNDALAVTSALHSNGPPQGHIHAHASGIMSGQSDKKDGLNTAFIQLLFQGISACKAVAGAQDLGKRLQTYCRQAAKQIAGNDMVQLMSAQHADLASLDLQAFGAAMKACNVADQPDAIQDHIGGFLASCVAKLLAEATARCC